MSVVSLPGFRIIGGLLVLATVVAGVVELDLGSGSAPQGTGMVSGGPSAPAGLPAAAPLAAASPLPAGVAETQVMGAPAGPAVVVPVDPAVAFMNAVKAAREMPQPPPPPAIAQARSFPEAFEAMKQAEREREPAAPLAGVSPFGAAAR